MRLVGAAYGSRDLHRREMVCNLLRKVPRGSVWERLTERLLGISEHAIEFYTGTYDANRFPGPEHEALFAAFLQGKYADTPIDLVIALGPTSLTFAEARGRELFPHAPRRL